MENNRYGVTHIVKHFCDAGSMVNQGTGSDRRMMHMHDGSGLSLTNLIDGRVSLARHNQKRFC